MNFKTIIRDLEDWSPAKYLNYNQNVHVHCSQLIWSIADIAVKLTKDQSASTSCVMIISR